MSYEEAVITWLQIQIQIRGPDNGHLVTNTRRLPDYSVEAVFPATSVVSTRSLAKKDLRDLRFISWLLLKFVCLQSLRVISDICTYSFAEIVYQNTILHARSLTRTYGKMLQIVMMTLWLYMRVKTLFRNRKMVVSAVSFWVSIKLFTLSRHCT